MERAELVRRIAARSGLGFEEAERLLEVVVEELSIAAARRRTVDLDVLGRLEPEPGAPGVRFRPSPGHSAFGAHRRE